MTERKHLSSEVPPAVPISDRGYLQACVHIANDRSNFDDGTVAKLEPAPDASLINYYLTVMHFENPDWNTNIHEDFARVFRTNAKELRAMLRQSLGEICNNIARARQKLRSRTDVMLDGVAVETELHLSRDFRVEHRHRYAPRDHEAAVALLTVFLLDPDKPFGDELRECALEECTDYFFSLKNPAGGPRRKYCSDEHSETADKMKALERQARRRERRKT